MTRDEAWSVLREYTKSESLLRHALAVESAMRYYAHSMGQDVEMWGIAGLLHDFDYEKWPEPPQHSREGAKILRALNVDEEIIAAVLSHADWNVDEYPRDRPIRKVLYAVDELSGFVVAVACVRPERLKGMTAKSVRKKLKDRTFAAAVDRGTISDGAELLGLDLEKHITNVIAALESSQRELGLCNE